ncbi:MAG: sugar ABC transporter permease [Clostridium sp.]|nr:sugar ABC transporter permease [Clostridium sp.]
MKVKQGHWIWPYLLIAPALLTMLCVVFIPVVQAIVTSFQYYDLRYPGKTQFLGLGNYIEIFTQDPQFWPSIFRTLVWVVFGVGLQFLFGFILALILNRKFFGCGVVRALSMVPWVTPGVLIGLMWRWLYDGNYGVINDVLIRLGILEHGISFLSRHEAAMPAAVVSVVWQGIPFFALMLLAALQGVSSDMYEAADINGASGAQKLFYITIPSIKNTLFVTVLLRIIWVANSVDIIQNMTAGGPAYATQTLSIYVYQKAHVLNLGYASAMSVILAVLLLVVAVPYLRFTFQSERS